MEILAKIYIDLPGLANSLKRDGSSTENDLRDFMNGFAQAKSTFDVIDVGGSNKQCVEFKIKETTHFNLRNYNCRQVLLGVSQDTYAPFLDEISDDISRQRVSIIEGCPVAKEIVASGVTIRNLETIFRSDKLSDKAVLDKASATNSASSMASTPVSVAAVPFTYATITQKASPPPQLVLPLAPKTSTTKPAAVRIVAKPVASAWNPGPRGLDPPIPINQNVLDVVKKRTGHDKLCNNHYLRGPCAKGDSCCFEHIYQPNPEEIRAIQFLARLNPCTNGQDCDVDNCIYGHHVSQMRT